MLALDASLEQRFLRTFYRKTSLLLRAKDELID
jgi:hypothetical protein